MNQKQKKKIIGLYFWVTWLVIGMFLGLGLTMLFDKPILATYLFVFAFGLSFIEYFILRCYQEIEVSK